MRYSNQLLKYATPIRYSNANNSRAQALLLHKKIAKGAADNPSLLPPKGFVGEGKNVVAGADLDADHAGQRPGARPEDLWVIALADEDRAHHQSEGFRRRGRRLAAAPRGVKTPMSEGGAWPGSGLRMNQCGRHADGAFACRSDCGALLPGMARHRSA